MICNAQLYLSYCIIHTFIIFSSFSQESKCRNDFLTDVVECQFVFLPQSPLPSSSFLLTSGGFHKTSHPNNLGLASGPPKMDWKCPISPLFELCFQSEGIFGHFKGILRPFLCEYSKWKSLLACKSYLSCLNLCNVPKNTFFWNPPKVPVFLRTCQVQLSSTLLVALNSLIFYFVHSHIPYHTQSQYNYDF